MWVTALMQALSSMGSAAAATGAKNLSEEQARSILERSHDSYGKLDVPKLQQLMGEALGPTELSKIQTDPALARAQHNALDKLGEQANGGFNLQDEAELAAAMGKVGRQEAAGRGAIRENMAARGTLGSGAELAMQLQNQQGSANRANEVGMDAAGRSQSRAYDAMLQRGRLAGQMREQDYGEKSKAAQAQDLINKYNATRGPEAAKTQYQMELQRLEGMNGQNPGLAASYRNQGNNDASLYAGLGTAVNQGATALSQNNSNNDSTYDVSRPANPDDDLDKYRNQGP